MKRIISEEVPAFGLERAIEQLICDSIDESLAIAPPRELSSTTAESQPDGSGIHVSTTPSSLPEISFGPDLHERFRIESFGVTTFRWNIFEYTTFDNSSVSTGSASPGDAHPGVRIETLSGRSTRREKITCHVPTHECRLQMRNFCIYKVGIGMLCLVTLREFGIRSRPLLIGALKHGTSYSPPRRTPSYPPQNSQVRN